MQIRILNCKHVQMILKAAGSKQLNWEVLHGAAHIDPPVQAAQHVFTSTWPLYLQVNGQRANGPGVPGRHMTSHDTRNSGLSDSTCEASTFWRRSCPSRRLKSSQPLSDARTGVGIRLGPVLWGLGWPCLALPAQLQAEKSRRTTWLTGKISALKKCKHNSDDVIVSVGTHLAQNMSMSHVT